MQPVTLRQQIAELKRELSTRQRVYPSWIQRGQISALDADYRTRALAAAVTTLEHLAEERFKAEASSARASRR